MIEAIRRRRRLQIHSVVSDRLTRYEDPETGRLYVGRWSWDPFMIPCVVTLLQEAEKDDESD